MAKVIGKADKFYTLWEITEDTHTMADGRHYTVTHHIYVKNLSFNKETAMANFYQYVSETYPAVVTP